MLAEMGASLAATACCTTSGLRRMLSSRAGPSSSVRFRLVKPRSNSGACRAVGFHRGDPETTALKSLSIARSENFLFIFGLTYCEGP